MDTPAASKSTQAPPTEKLGFAAFFGLLVDTGKAWMAHRAQTMGAALSYYTTFSLAPLVVFIFSLASLVVQKTEASSGIVKEVRAVVGDRGADAVQQILNHANSAEKTAAAAPAKALPGKKKQPPRHRSDFVGAVLSFIVLMIGASGAFGELQDSLNLIWEVPPQKHPFLTMIKERALSFAMLFVLGFFMLVSALLSALTTGLSQIVMHQFPVLPVETFNDVLSLIIFTVLFCVIFRVLPDVEILWSDVWLGAVISSVLFILGKFLLGLYIGFSSTTFSRYGAAGSFIIIMVWVFYSAQILFLGAEFTRVYTLKFGSHRGEKEGASTAVAAPAPS